MAIFVLVLVVVLRPRFPVRLAGAESTKPRHSRPCRRLGSVTATQAFRRMHVGRVQLTVMTCLIGACCGSSTAAEPKGGSIRLIDVTSQSKVTFVHTDGGSGRQYLFELTVAGLGNSTTPVRYANSSALVSKWSGSVRGSTDLLATRYGLSDNLDRLPSNYASNSSLP